MSQTHVADKKQNEQRRVCENGQHNGCHIFYVGQDACTVVPREPMPKSLHELVN